MSCSRRLPAAPALPPAGPPAHTRYSRPIFTLQTRFPRDPAALPAAPSLPYSVLAAGAPPGLKSCLRGSGRTAAPHGHTPRSGVSSAPPKPNHLPAFKQLPLAVSAPTRPVACQVKFMEWMLTGMAGILCCAFLKSWVNGAIFPSDTIRMSSSKPAEGKVERWAAAPSSPAGPCPRPPLGRPSYR